MQAIFLLAMIGLIAVIVYSSMSKTEPLSNKRKKVDQISILRKQLVVSAVVFVLCELGGFIWGLAIDASTSEPTSRGMARAFGPGLYLGIPSIIVLIVAITSGIRLFSERHHTKLYSNATDKNKKQNIVINERVNQKNKKLIKGQVRQSSADLVFQSLVVFIEVVCVYLVFESVRSVFMYNDFHRIIDFTWSGLPILLILTALTTIFIFLKFSPKLKFLYLFLMFLALANLVSPYIVIPLTLFAGIISTKTIRTKIGI